MDANWEQMPQITKSKVIAVLILLLVIVLVSVITLSIVNIGGDRVGIIEKKMGGGSLAQGQILAAKGENGIQAQTLTPGWHFFYWPWQYKITKVPLTEIKDGYVGLIQAIDGQSLPTGTIFAPEWHEPKKMLDAAYFLDEGKGFKGPQLSVLTPGKYRLNTKLFTITSVPITNVEVGTVAVIKSNVGEMVETAERLVKEGQIGIWDKPLTEGKYRLHTNAYEVTTISIRLVKVSYSTEKEYGEGRTQPMKPIIVRSKDGFTFPVVVRMTYRIDSENAPRVVADVGDDDQVLTKLVTPAVRAIFRNNAEKVKALEYVQNRSVQEQQSLQMLQDVLVKDGITVLAVRIGDVGDEESLGALLKTQTDREIALQEQTTFEVQERAAEKQKALSRTQQEAEEEKNLAIAAYGVKIAEQKKQEIIIAAQAKAEQVKLIAQAKAEAYRLIAKVLGSDNAALIEIMKLVASDKIKITPDVMIGGAGGGITDALMGTMLKGMLKEKSRK